MPRGPPFEGDYPLGPGELLKISTLRSWAGGSTCDTLVAGLSSKFGVGW